MASEIRFGDEFNRRVDAGEFDLDEIAVYMRHLEGAPSEEGHVDADRLVALALRKLGAANIASSYERVGKWYS